MQTNADVIVVGGGAAGVLTAVQLLRSDLPARLALIEKGERLGAGVAYGTLRPEHLLNLPAVSMSAFEDDPDHFVRYLRWNSSGDCGAAALESVFATRRRYATYLRATLADERDRSRASLEVVHDEVVGLDGSDVFRLTLRSGRELRARSVVLALGNWSRDLPVPDDPAARTAVLSGWDHSAIARIRPTDTVVIAGSGLSMVDTLLTLLSHDHDGPIHVVSRRALLPLPHAPRGTVDLDVDGLSERSLRERVAVVRARAAQAMARGEPWQWVMETLRPHVSRLWRTLSVPDQQRFLRQASRYWDVHRHRLPAHVAGTIGSLFASGRVTPHAGRITSIQGDRDRLQVRFGGDEPLEADTVINCAGMQSDVRKVADPLVQSLLAAGRARPGPHGIGIATDPSGALIDRWGRPHPRLLTIGSARIGSLWESVAVPELRVQASVLAQRITAEMRGRLTSVGHLVEDHRSHTI